MYSLSTSNYEQHGGSEQDAEASIKTTPTQLDGSKDGIERLPFDFKLHCDFKLRAPAKKKKKDLVLLYTLFAIFTCSKVLLSKLQLHSIYTL